MIKPRGRTEPDVPQAFTSELYMYTWKADCQSKSEGKNGGHGAILDVCFRPLRSYFGSLSPFADILLRKHKTATKTAEFLLKN